MKTKQKNNQLKYIILFSFFLMNYLIGFSQDENTKTGFYVNYGNTKVSELNCYDFDNLYFKFKVTPEMYEYEEIIMESSVGTADVMENSMYKRTGRLTGKRLQRLFEENKNEEDNMVSIYLPIKSSRDKGGNIEYTRYKRNVDGSRYGINIWGTKLSGEETKWDSYSQSYKTTPTYKHILLAHGELILNNRKHIKRKIGENIPIVWFFVKEQPCPEITQTGNCFPYDGEIKENPFLLFAPSK